MWKKELIPNKIIAVVLLAMGILSLVYMNDGTFFVVSFLLAISAFFTKDKII